MTDREEKVAIAKDVIAQLDVKRFIAKTGIYLRLAGRKDFMSESSFFTEELNMSPYDEVTPDLLKKEVKKCEACARGALFVAEVERYNRVRTVDDFDFYERPKYSQTRVFDEDELCDIELIFETTSEMFDYDNTGIDVRRFVGAEERMRIIMQSVIDNGGLVDATDMARKILKIARDQI